MRTSILILACAVIGFLPPAAWFTFRYQQVKVSLTFITSINVNQFFFQRYIVYYTQTYVRTKSPTNERKTENVKHTKERGRTLLRVDPFSSYSKHLPLALFHFCGLFACTFSLFSGQMYA